MLKILLIAFALVYMRNISKHYLDYHQVKIGIKKLQLFLNAYSLDSSAHIEELNSLLQYAPVIAKYVNTPSLSYEDYDEITRRYSETLFYKLMMIRNQKQHALIESLNPFLSIRDTILFPVTVLQWLDYHPGRTASSFLSGLGWFVTYLLDMFQPEIKMLLVALFEKLIAA